MKGISIASALWGTVLVFVGGRVLDSEGLVFCLFGIPALGLPMLFFALHENSKAGEKTTVGDAVGAILGGALWTSICPLPVFVVLFVVVTIVRKVF